MNLGSLCVLCAVRDLEGAHWDLGALGRGREEWVRQPDRKRTSASRHYGPGRGWPTGMVQSQNPSAPKAVSTLGGALSLNR